MVSQQQLPVDRVASPPSMAPLLTCVLMTVALIHAGCDQVRLRFAAPDGQRVAEVRSRWTAESPVRSLWIRGPGKRLTKLRDLGMDAERCDRAVWSANGSFVGFLINGVYLDVYAMPQAEMVAHVPLVSVDGHPGSREARDGRLAPDGKVVQFRDCRRREPVCGAVRRIPVRHVAASPARF